MSDEKLAALRAEIDALDRQLVELLNRRGRLALKTAELKGRQDEAAYYRPEREAQILERVRRLNEGPLPDQALAQLVREIMSACRALEARLRIACLGPAGTFTQAAVFRHFGHSVETALFSNIDQVFREVEAGNCHYGVAPVENSVEGAVNRTLDLLTESKLKISGEVELRIHQNLLSRAAALADIEVVYSHEQSLAQCRHWLDEHLPGARRAPVASNAEAALNASQDPKAAAVAGKGAAQLYELPLLSENIEDDPDNATRFLVLGREAVAASGRDKTSVLFATPSRPGALLKLLECFANHGVNMTRIESRPSRQTAWEYVFFADVNGHRDDEQVAAALAELRDKAAMVKWLGSYPAAVA